jgi:hypothetical protein
MRSLLNVTVKSRKTGKTNKAKTKIVNKMNRQTQAGIDEWAGQGLQDTDRAHVHARKNSPTGAAYEALLMDRRSAADGNRFTTKKKKRK